VIATPRGVPVLRPATERGSPAHRDFSERWDDDVTGKYEGEELERARARRKTDDRIARLEVKHDKLDEKVDRMEVVLARVDSRTEAREQSDAELTSLLREQLRAKNDTERVKVTTTLDIDKHERVTKVDTQALAVRARWKLALTVASGLFSASVIGAVIALAAQRC